MLLKTAGINSLLALEATSLTPGWLPRGCPLSEGSRKTFHVFLLSFDVSDPRLGDTSPQPLLCHHVASSEGRKLGIGWVPRSLPALCGLHDKSLHMRMSEWWQAAQTCTSAANCSQAEIRRKLGSFTFPLLIRTPVIIESR